MAGNDDVCHYFQDGANDGQASAAVPDMKPVTDEGRDSIASKGTQKDEGGDGVSEIVVLLNLKLLSAISPVG